MLLRFAKGHEPHRLKRPATLLAPKFWTGEGRTKPVIKTRSDAIIQSVSMVEVPTGYLGPEGNLWTLCGPDATWGGLTITSDAVHETGRQVL